MWPKLLMQVAEQLLPHASRLLPTASSNSSSNPADDGTAKALEALRSESRTNSAQLRRDLAAALEAMAAQNKYNSAELRGLQDTIDGLNRTVGRGEARQKSQSTILVLVLILNLVLLVLVALLYFRH